jgi:hypothetical protein
MGTDRSAEYLESLVREPCKTDRFVDSPPRSRNELLASVMRRIGTCEERGSGWDKVVFQSESLVSSRYERSSLIVNSNKTFSAWTEIFGDAVAVAALVDRLVHHSEIITLKGDSYRLKGKKNAGITTMPAG